MTDYLCDTNVWLAIAVAPHTHHAVARAWFDEVPTFASIHFCRSTQQSFLRLVTSGWLRATYGLSPLTNAQALEAYSAFLRDDRVVFTAQEPDGIEQRWLAFARRTTSSPKLWMDAYLAAFARAASLQLVTFDRAFRQFDGLDVLILEDMAQSPEGPLGA